MLVNVSMFAFSILPVSSTSITRLLAWWRIYPIKDCNYWLIITFTNWLIVWYTRQLQSTFDATPTCNGESSVSSINLYLLLSQRYANINILTQLLWAQLEKQQPWKATEICSPAAYWLIDWSGFVWIPVFLFIASTRHFPGLKELLYLHVFSLVSIRRKIR